MDVERATERAEFIAATDWRGGRVRDLAGDASNRRYFRIQNARGGAPAVLMDAPPAKGEALFPFLAVGEALRDLGFSAPRTFATDAERGFAIIEDLGDDLYARVCARDPASEIDLYERATDLLARLASIPAPADLSWNGTESPLAPYDVAALEREALLVLEWWAPLASGAPVAADAVAEFRATIRAACADVAGDRSALVLRDFHAENLIWLPERGGLSAVGLLDYQDALAGSPAYDLVSLLEDARRDTDKSLRDGMFARFVSATGFNQSDFAVRYSTLGAQRNLKILGIFARLCVRDGKSEYLSLMPRVWRHLLRDLTAPALAPLRRFVETQIPAPTRSALARVEASAR